MYWEYTGSSILGIYWQNIIDIAVTTCAHQFLQKVLSIYTSPCLYPEVLVLAKSCQSIGSIFYTFAMTTGARHLLPAVLHRLVCTLGYQYWRSTGSLLAGYWQSTGKILHTAAVTIYANQFLPRVPLGFLAGTLRYWYWRVTGSILPVFITMSVYCQYT